MIFDHFNPKISNREGVEVGIQKIEVRRFFQKFRQSVPSDTYTRKKDPRPFVKKKIQIIKEILLLQQYQQKVRKFQFLESNIVQKKVIWKRQRKENPKKLFNKEKLQESIQNICGRVKFFLEYSKSGDILIMDNLSVHKNKKCLEKLQKAGIQVMFLPTYSAIELSPLDNSLFHQLKQNLKNKE